jgi:hypothetical protein
MSGVGMIHGITSKFYDLRHIVIVSCLFFDCWFISFENVSHRSTSGSALQTMHMVSLTMSFIPEEHTGGKEMDIKTSITSEIKSEGYF